MMKVDSVRNLKITTLADNLTMTECLGQWGLSFLLELLDARGDRRKMIFDTGLHKRPLLNNIKRLKVDLHDVDCVVISHGHGDHTGAIVEVVKAAGGVNVYAHPHVFLPRFHKDKRGKRRKHGVPKSEGIDKVEDAGGRVILAREAKELVPGVWTTGQIKRVTGFEQPLPLSKGEKITIVVDGEEVDDQILDDQALWMSVESFGPMVVGGCSHAGSINTLMHVERIGGFKKICGFAGGMHLVGRSDEYLQQTIKELKRFGLNLISPCHCTGFKAASALWIAFPNSFVLNFSGRVIDFEKKLKFRVI